MPAVRRLLILEPPTASGGTWLQHLVQGICTGIGEQPRWAVRRHQAAPGGPLFPVSWRPDAVVATGSVADARLADWGGPAVGIHESSLPIRVEIDQASIGACAADHLIDKGLRHLLLLTLGPHRGWAAGRATGFTTVCRRRGVDLAELPGIPDDEPRWQRRFLATLGRLPQPVGIFAGNDVFARRIIELCQESDRRIPMQAAVLGADDDEVACALGSVPLSSVRVPHREAGILAAHLVHSLVDGQRVPPGTRLVRAHQVAERLSTGLEAITAPELVRALQFIEDHACSPIGVDAVVTASGIGRRTLETRFQRQLGMTILAAIHRARIRTAEIQLATTRHSVLKIALACGFADGPHFARIFRQVRGISPIEFRRFDRNERRIAPA